MAPGLDGILQLDASLVVYCRYR